MNMRRMAGLLTMGVLAMATTGCVGCGAHYSDGDRSGVITKFSRKGLVFESWEGEMVLGGIRGGSDGTSAANVWAFSAPSRLAKQISEAQRSGARVTVHYNQWLASPVDQDSAYTVTSITVEPTAPTTTATP